MSPWKSIKKITVLSAALLASMAFLPAQATILHGYLEEQTQPAPVQVDSTSGASETPLPNSYPSGYQGSWHCITTVSDSGVASIPAGQTMLSDVNFVRQADGRIVANWMQPGWTESQATVTAFSNTEARVDRTNYFVCKDLDQSWAARSRDQFSQTSRESITAKSYVDQYVDGQFIGRYRTTSVLHKAPGSNIAFAK